MTTSAAIITTTLCSIGTLSFLLAFHASTHGKPPAGAGFALIAALLFIPGAGPILFINPVIAGYLIAVGVLLVVYANSIERLLVDRTPTPDQLLPESTDDLATATRDMDREMRLIAGRHYQWMGPPLLRYRSPAEFHHRHQDGPR